MPPNMRRGPSNTANLLIRKRRGPMTRRADQAGRNGRGGSRLVTDREAGNLGGGWNRTIRWRRPASINKDGWFLTTYPGWQNYLEEGRRSWPSSATFLTARRTSSR